MIEKFAKIIPAELRSRSGKVFYSGRRAFSKPSTLYMIGINPGGDPLNHKKETVENHTTAVLQTYPDDWSAYRDESWEGRSPGTYGMATRVIHLLNKLDLDPGSVPSSNLVFVRSCREADIRNEMKRFADLCWPFHALVIENLHPKVILCLGRTVGNYVRNRVGANTLLSEFVEQNKRKWRNQVFTNQTGLNVVIATHPSIADWREPNTDPTPLVKNALK